MQHHNRLFAALIISLFSAAIPALESDREQPIQIEADAATYNEKSETGTYTGNVKLTQGSFRLWSDKLVVHNKNREVDKLIITGKPAKFRQTPEKQKEDVQGSALRMEYYGKGSRLIMLKEAKIWQGENSTASERIEYDSLNSIIQAGKKQSGSQRVKVILKPQNNKQK